MTRRRFRTIAIILAALALPACAAAPPPAKPVTVTAPPGSGTQYIRVPLTDTSGTPHVAVTIAGVCCFTFTLDTGASDVSVSPALFRAMVKGGHVTRDDLIDVQRYRTANGVVEGLRFRMPPMSVGGRTVHGVIASVSAESNMLLLGMSFLRKFKFFAIDAANGVLVLGG